MIEQLQLLGQLLVVVLVYVFTWRALAVGRRELRLLSGAVPTTGPGEVSRIAAVEESSVMPVVRSTGAVGSTWLVAIGGSHMRSGQPIHMDEAVTIGRGADTDIQLDDDFLSGKHARLRPPNLLTDLDSTNGTFVNDVRIKGTVRLSSGDTVRLGGTTFRFEDGS